ncbi:MAG: hypothetical protein ACYDHG_01935 [Desulfomonilaceae bacterium]
MLENLSVKGPSNSSSCAKRLNTTDRLSLIGLIHDGILHGSEDSPVASDLYEELWDLVDSTVSGAKIDKLNVGKSTRGFRTFEINSEIGENLGRLNMLYLNKPVPCFYLVYVEVAAPFRNKGLGNLVLREFRDFLIEKSAIGVLDNIIPSDDPTFEIYRKFDWQPYQDVACGQGKDKDDAYMIYIPPAHVGKDLKDSIIRLVHHIRRRRPAIDMRDNEIMVQRTIEEFKDLYRALLAYFSDQKDPEENDSLKRFMFTRYVTKLLGFRRRISQLLGYTGGESMEQIPLSPSIRDIPAKSYGPAELKNRTCFLSGDRELWLHLPELLKSNPARFIEALPNYKRPSFMSWLSKNGKTTQDALTLGDLIDLGFDPTRLKEIQIDGATLIFERTPIRALPKMENKREFLNSLLEKAPYFIVKNTKVRFNPPLLLIRDRGNGYILRKKVPGIHWEEAVEQLNTSPALKELNDHLGLERIVTRTVAKVNEKMKSYIEGNDLNLSDPSGIFVSWDLETNQPRMVVDMTVSYLETVWIS